jgi:acyl-CoA synthetase (AMP-forming)/AMP-acid ligase II
VVTRGQNIMVGYHNDPVRRESKDGWLHTGDLATVDEEGRSISKDRKFIKVGGTHRSMEMRKSFCSVLPSSSAQWWGSGGMRLSRNG